MKEYHKIDTLFKRDMQSQQKTLIEGDWTNEAFAYLARNEWEFTEKVDGTNIRIMIADGAVNFGGRTDNASIPAPLVQRLQERFLAQADFLHEIFPDGCCLYGEGYGAKIQSGGNYRPDQDFVLFDVRIGEFWLERANVLGIAEKIGVGAVPVIGRGNLFKAVEMVRAGFNSQWGEFPAEGIVARPTVELRMRGGSRIITKLKHKDFVGKTGDD